MKPQTSLFQETFSIQQIIDWVGEEWAGYLQPEFNSAYMINMFEMIKKDKLSNRVYPKTDDVFKIYRMLPPNKVKMAIISQSPYPADYGDGIAFSTYRTIPKSLKKIQENFKTSEHNLEYLVEQGVWLQNCILTCNYDTLGHKNWGWERFVEASLRVISNRNRNMVWWAWGSDAKRMVKPVVTVHHQVRYRPHPVNKGIATWDISQDISDAQKYLKTYDKGEINFSNKNLTV